MSKQEPALSWNIAGVFLLLFIGLLTAGIIYYTIEKRDITREKHNELHAISSLKTSQIHNWYTERHRDAQFIMQNRNFGALFSQWLANRNNPYFPLVFNDLAASLNHYETYYDIILADTSSAVLLSQKKNLEMAGPETRHFIQRAVINNGIIFTDFYLCSVDGQVHIDVIAPIYTTIGGKSVIAGALILRIDPRHHVYGMIQSWPTPSNTAETLLVRREGDDVVYLNELRHRKDTALKLRINLSNSSLPAVMAVTGKEGIVEGVDYRNVPVLADIRRIPDMPWFIVAKVDIDEIYAPVHRLLAAVIMVTALLIAAAWGGLSWWWNKQRLKFYRMKYETETKYRTLEKEFENLTRYANDIIVVADEDQKIIQFNERAVQAYWYTRDELTGMHLKDIRSPEAAGSLQEQLREAEERNGLVFETTHRRKDGSTFPVEVSLRFIRHDDRKYSLGIIRDITERKHAEDALRKREEQLRMIFETSQAGIILVDPYGTVTFANQRMADMFGCSMEKLIGSSYPEHVHPDERQMGDLAMRRLIAGEIDSVSVERHYLRADGSDLWGFISGRRLIDESGNLISLVGIIADITDRRKAEDEVRRLNESLEQRVRERTAQLEDANFRIAENAARLEAANNELEAFSYSVSHDLRAPLRSVDEFSKAVLEEYADRLNGKGRHYLDRVRESSRHMAHLIDDLLKFSRLSRAEIHAEKVDLSAFVRSLAAELSAREPEREVDFIIAENVTATGDPALLKVAIENLLRNAWKFTSGHPRARIEFGTLERNGTREYFVRDDGAGFDMKYADRLFAPFQRLHGIDEFEGTGIGLALVRRIVNRHRGTVRAEGEVEKGATIYFTLGAS